MLVKKAVIRRLRSGIYDYSKFNAGLGGQLSFGIYDVELQGFELREVVFYS
jgi:hypothetical protein